MNRNKSKNNKTKKNNNNNGKRIDEINSLTQLISKENFTQYEIETNEIRDIESRIFNIQNTQDNNIEYYYLSQIEYELYLKTGKEDKIQAAISNMWRVCTNNPGIKYPFTFLGTLYKASGNRAAALVCFFYSAKLSYDVQALRNLVEFYESGIEWLAINEELVADFKNLIAEIECFSQNESSLDITQKIKNDNSQTKNDAITFLGSYNILPGSIKNIENEWLPDLISTQLSSSEAEVINKISNMEKKFHEIDNDNYITYKDEKIFFVKPNRNVKKGELGSYFMEQAAIFHNKNIRGRTEEDFKKLIGLLWQAFKAKQKEALNFLGRAYLQHGDRVEAFACFFYSVKKYEDPTSMLSLAEFYKNGETWLPKNMQLTYQLYKKAADKNYNDAYYLLAEHCFLIDRKNESIQAANKYINSKGTPYYTRCLFLLGCLYYSIDRDANHEKIVSYFEKIIEIANRPGCSDIDKTQEKNSLMLLTKIYVAKKEKLDIALNYCEKLRTIDKYLGCTYLTQALIYKEKGDIERCKVSMSLAEAFKAEDVYYYYSELYYQGIVFDRNLKLCFEYAKKHINSEGSDYKHITMYGLCHNLITIRLEKECLSEQEINELQEERAQYLLMLLKLYERLDDNQKSESKWHMIYTYKNLASHFGDSDESLWFLYFTHKAALLNDVEAQYSLALFYFEKSTVLMNGDNFAEALELAQRSAHYFHLAGNQGMIKAIQYHDDINYRINFLKTTLLNEHHVDDTIVENSKNNAENEDFNFENIIVNVNPKIDIESEEKLSKMKISAAKMFVRVKDKQDIWQKKKKKETFFNLSQQSSISPKAISWFDGCFNGANSLIKPMVYLAGTHPAFIFVDAEFLRIHKKNFGQNAASFYNNAQFRFHPSNVKKLKNDIKYPVTYELPNGRTETVECTHEWKLEGKSRMLLFKRLSDLPKNINNLNPEKNAESRARLYVAAKYLKNGLHRRSDEIALINSDSVVKLNWPKS